MSSPLPTDPPDDASARPSSPLRDQAEAHEAVAAGWMVRRQDGLSAADDLDFQRWLAADPAHAEALAQMEGVWDRLGMLPARDTERWRASVALPSRQRPVRSPSRRGGFRGLVPLVPRLAAFALVLAMVGGGWMGWDAWQRQPTFHQAFATQRGQLQEVRLPDGSTLWLDTATQVDVTLFRHRREVRLPEGQALFAVKANAGQPFDVLAGPLRITVVGTRFSVRCTRSGLGAGGVTVVVEEGRVRVARQEASGAVELTQGQAIVGNADGQLGPVLAQVPGNLMPWREGRVSFDGVPLAQALAEFERYGDTRLVVRDPAVAALRINGSFDLQRLDAFKRALPRVLPVALRRVDGVTEIVKTAVRQPV